MSGEFFFESVSGIQLHGYRWEPAGEPKAIVQLVHGIGDHIARYEHFAAFLNAMGYLMVAEDHMGHGKSICEQVPEGCFVGGWDTVVEDSYRLLRDMKAEFPDVPYILLGQSMGSFLVRSILIKHPDSGIAGAIICGSTWKPDVVIAAGRFVCNAVSKLIGERTASNRLHELIFGGYNRRIKNPRCEFDWLSRDDEVVRTYQADALCMFTPSCGMLRDMMEGLLFNQNRNNLAYMEKDLPIFFVAGIEDPVGNYGKGVRKTAEMFLRSGMKYVSVRLYPDCRHEILSELNKEEVFGDISAWMDTILK